MWNYVVLFKKYFKLRFDQCVGINLKKMDKFQKIWSLLPIIGQKKLL